MNEKVDTRGLSCPQPVILVQNAIKNGKFPIEVIVDSVTSRENVLRIAEKLGCNVSISREGEEYILVLQK